MAGTKSGAKKAVKHIKQLYGIDFYVRLGKLGGAAGHGHKFAHGKIDPHIAGKMGGKVTWLNREPK